MGTTQLLKEERNVHHQTQKLQAALITGHVNNVSKS